MSVTNQVVNLQTQLSNQPYSQSLSAHPSFQSGGSEGGAAPDVSWLRRGVSEIFPNAPNSENPDENLMRRLSGSRPLRVKFGIDATGADIHLGHSIPMRKLRAFQDAGHTAVLIIGDFTARIGDPTAFGQPKRQTYTSFKPVIPPLSQAEPFPCSVSSLRRFGISLRPLRITTTRNPQWPLKIWSGQALNMMLR